MKKPDKVLIIGLDCFEPSLVFEQWKDQLPTFAKLRQHGHYGRLKSTIPAITVPAWMSMMTSRNPGAMGFYGFRNRKDHSYDDMFFANSNAVKVPTLWKILSRKRKKVVVMGVPQTYPPKPVNGCLIGCFLTPDTDADFTYPKDLKQEIWDNVGEYIIDVKNFRTDDKDYLLDQIYKMTDRRFETADYLMKNKPWDFFMMVEMGPDRLHHGMWKYHDPNHVGHVPDSPYKDSIRDYYIHLDRKIGELLKNVDLNNTAVMIVSDHGAKKMDGGFCFNDWLIQEGYLVLKEPVTSPRTLKNSDIDFTKTKVWGSGGYYGRLFINVEGREKTGVIPSSEYENFRTEVKERLEAVVDHNGDLMGNAAFRPQDIYSEVNGVSPDLIVYFGDLSWRSLGTIGNESLYVFENDTGPDDANHAQHGMYIAAVPGLTGSTEEERHITDISPTVLSLLEVPIPAEMEGTAMEFGG